MVTETEVIEFLADILYKSVKYPKREDCIQVLQDHPFDALEDILQKVKTQAIEKLKG
jgi:hypothetical protein